MRRTTPLLRKLFVGAVATTALASGLTGLVGAPASHGPHVSMRSHQISADTVGAGWSTVQDLDSVAEMVGFTWQGSAAHLDVRAVDGDGTHGWYHVDGEPQEGPDAGTKEFHDGRVSAGPVWVGHGVHRVEVRVTDGSVTGLNVHAIDTQPASTSGTALGATPVADAAVQPPGIISRADWGADESWRTYADGCDGKPDYASDTRFAVVHHTVNSNDYGPGDSASLVRGIYYFHTHTNGWCDIGYNFLIDRYGQIFEGRAGGINKPVIGAHSGGFNTYSTGVAVIGDFQSASVPDAAYNALRSLLAFKLSYHGIDPEGITNVVPYDSPFSRYPAGQPVPVNNISGHTDVDSTECPGARLYALLPYLRDDVAWDVAVNRDQRFMGDWNGDGVATPGAFKDGLWVQRDANNEGPVTRFIAYGDSGDIPIVGDWNGDGVDTIGVYRNGTFYLRNSNSTGVADVVVSYGNPGDLPVVGDWDGDGVDTIGVYRNGTFYLRNANTTGVADIVSPYGNAGDIPVAGDWNTDGRDTPSIVRHGVWYLRDSLQKTTADHVVGFGNATDVPVPYVVSSSNTTVAGITALKTHKWALGVARGSYWFLSSDATSGSATNVFPF